MHAHPRTPDMLSVEEARARILALVSVLEAEERPLLDALGQVLAEDVVAGFDIPPWDNSAMDGYAVRHEDVAGATPDNPTTLRVVGHLMAGQIPEVEVEQGTALRIMTGALMPPGADAVVPFEETDEVERRSSGQDLVSVSILREARKGEDVRPSGEDVSSGQLVLRGGTVLRPGEIGVLASLGYASVKVVRRPEVAIIATGDELVTPGEPLAQAKVYDSNSYGIAALVKRYGGIPRPLGIAGDNMDSINKVLDQGLSADMVITSAGVSKGDYDIVKDVLAERGEVSFWAVRMRPAKPMAFGILRAGNGRSVPHLGLPGNPVSAIVSFEELGRPALLKMMGRQKLDKPTIEAILEDSIANHDGRRVYARAIVTKRDGIFYARTTGPQGSNLLTSMGRANGLAICPEEVPEMHKGQRVQVRMLDWNEEDVY